MCNRRTEHETWFSTVRQTSSGDYCHAECISKESAYNRSALSTIEFPRDDLLPGLRTPAALILATSRTILEMQLEH